MSSTDAAGPQDKDSTAPEAGKPVGEAAEKIDEANKKKKEHRDKSHKKSKEDGKKEHRHTHHKKDAPKQAPETEPLPKSETPKELPKIDPIPISESAPVLPPPRKKVDRYGFELTKEKAISDKERELRLAESRKEAERETKWMKMFAQKDFSKLAERIMKGIPDTYRSQAWKLIIDQGSADPSIAKDRPKVETLFPKLPQEEWKDDYQCWQTIEVDLDRTMPDCSMFAEDQVRSSLRNVLRAYSCVDKELGYTQGMGFHAAMLLSYMDEECAFYCFKKLMSGQKYQIRHYFLPGFPRLNQLAQIWKVLLLSKYKKICQRFNNDGIDVMMYAPQWFLSAFMNQPFPPVLRMQIFDRYIAFGSRALLSFGLVIISRHKDQFLTDGMENVVPILQRPSLSPKMQDWRYLIKKWDEHWLNARQYKALFKNTGIEPFP